MDNVYNVWIIDDEFSEVRKDMYEKFLNKQYADVDIYFNIHIIEYAKDINKLNNKSVSKVDAFFIDARLDNPRKGWGESGYDLGFNAVLSKIERAFEQSKIPPIFMVSKHWTDENLLSMVSKSFSVFHQAVQPSRFFSLKNIEGCVRSAEEKNANGVLNPRELEEEREYIYNEIRKSKEKVNVAGIPIDAVLILAVADEKDMAYKVFNIQKKAKYNSTYQFYYNIANVEDYNVAIIEQTDMGMTNAALVATSAILAFKPKIVAMTGICAGKKDKTKLSDIIIPIETFDYSRGKKNLDGTEYRPTHQTLNSTINMCIKNNVNKELLTSIRTNYTGEYPDRDISVHMEPMATGSWVVNNPLIFEEISKFQSNCVALDMEAYAIGLTASRFNVDWIVIKSVQDYADGEKNKDEKLSRHFSAFSSAKILQDILPSLLDDIVERSRSLVPKS